MRLKSYFGSGLGEAMAQVRHELGEDAVIVSVEDEGDNGQTRIVAAIDRAEPEDDFIDTIVFNQATAGPDASLRSAVGDALARHGVPARLAGLLVGAARTVDAPDAVLALAGALDVVFTFRPIAQPDRPILLVGPPGGGKTVTAAKLGARAALEGKAVDILTTDCVRTGGIDQLANLAKHFEVQVRAAEDPDALAAALADADLSDLVVIDSVGTNPYAASEMRALDAFAKASKAEVVLVMPAGLDGEEAAETAHAFAAIGASRLIVTRLDSARRLGGSLAAAHAASLAFAEAGTAPHLLDGLGPLNPVGLARLLVRSWDQDSEIPMNENAA